MKISNIYLGLIPIVRAYQNDKIIWGLQNKISILGVFNSILTIKGKANMFTLFPLDGFGENFSKAKGVGNLIIFYFIKGLAGNKSNAIAIMTKTLPTLLAGKLKSVTNLVAKGERVQTINGQSDIEHNIYSLCLSYIVNVVVLNSLFNQSNSRTKGYGIGFEIAQIEGEDVKIVFQTKGKAQAGFLTSVCAKIKSNSETKAILNNYFTIFGSSKAISNLNISTTANVYQTCHTEGTIKLKNNTKTILNFLEALPLGGENNSRLLAHSSINTFTYQTIKNETKSLTSAIAVANIWQLPIQNKNILYIQQAYNTSVVDNIISII